MNTNYKSFFGKKQTNSRKGRQPSNFTQVNKNIFSMENLPSPLRTFSDKLKHVKKLATDSMFFPFTQPTVYNPATGRKIKGKQAPNMQQTFKKYGMRMPMPDIRSKNMAMLNKVIPIDRTRKLESHTFSQMNIQGGEGTGQEFGGLLDNPEPEVRFHKKDLHPAGHMKDLFKEGNNLELRNRHGEVVRKLRRTGNKVEIGIDSLNGGENVIEADVNDELVHEPWGMFGDEPGSILFSPKKENLPIHLRNEQFLKLGVEDDDLSPVKDEESENDIPIREEEDEKRRRLNRGYTNTVRINPVKFKKEFEKDQGEDLGWNQYRYNTAMGRDYFTSYPEVDTGMGKLDVNDGRHRLASAAKKKEMIEVAVKPESMSLILNKQLTQDIEEDDDSEDYKLPDGKEVIIKDNKNVPPKKVIWNTYKNIPDDKKIPIVFQTKEQYLKEYIANQEKKHNYNFPKWQEQQYINTELDDMEGISARYTTKHNKYKPPQTVYFTDVKWSPKQFRDTAFHEVGHEIYERNPKIKHDWKAVNKNDSPTYYGKTDKEEDFADSYMLYKNNKLQDLERKKIIESDMKSNNDIRFGRRPKDITPEVWEGHKHVVNKFTHKNNVNVDPRLKMFSVLDEDVELRKLNKQWNKDDEWHREYNEEARTALKGQGYNDEDVDGYLSERTKEDYELSGKMWEAIEGDKIINDTLFKEDKEIEEDDESENQMVPPQQGDKIGGVGNYHLNRWQNKMRAGRLM